MAQLVSDHDIRVLRAVKAAGERWCGGWVTSYDVAAEIVRDPGPHWQPTSRYVGQSILPPLMRRGLLVSIHRAGCCVMYRVSPSGAASLRWARVREVAAEAAP